MDKELIKWSKGLVNTLKDVLEEARGRQAIVNEFYWSTLSDVDKETLNKKLEDYDKRDKKAIEKEELQRVKENLRKILKEDKK